MAESELKIGNKIRDFRRAAGFTQERLAEESGLSVNFISRLERLSTTNLSLATLKRITDVLGVTLADFFTDKPIDENSILPNQRKFEKMVERLDSGERELIYASLINQIELFSQIGKSNKKDTP